ncbi:histidinol-phosphate transaminase [Sphingomonas sp. H39-1-10]|uniref:histidinol-phosphate transaminase n=1 Tax=Sphingomonadales TaxID=204457 RepID=UPI000C2028A8|nr:MULTISPECIES: histidinol-phosphate transaminase [Sphingomonadaceae]MDF0490121.1 histidinol-phosphate transaminase [Sphingomonas pollutisoli]PJG45459.1 histidinol-phosphate transaminase [Sphingobium sp. LB126]
MYERSNIRRMTGYVPGEQPCAPAIKLNTNENPLAPSNAVMQALSDITPAMLQRYPDPRAAKLRGAIANYHRCDVEQVIATNGSDELLRLAITTFAAPGHAIGVVEPGYNLYGVLASIQDCPVARAVLEDDWQLPADLAERWNKAGARLALLANPQAPSGLLIPSGTIARLAAEFQGVLLVDEAYVDFMDPVHAHNLVSLLDYHPNLLLVRTLSKGHSLAGLRLGYGLGAASLVDPMLTKVRDSYNVDAIAQHVATVAFGDVETTRKSWEFVRGERQRLSDALRGRGFHVFPSEANFVLTRVPESLGPASGLCEALAAEHIHVRWFDQARLDACLRITIGTTLENDGLLRAIDRIAKDAAAPALNDNETRGNAKIPG